MSKTIVGFFDDKSQAEETRDQLIGIGISESNIQMFSGAGADAQDAESFGDKIKHFFAHLGDWDQSGDSHYYAEGMRHGGTTLSVTAEDDQISRVTELMEQFGAVDINRRAEYMKQSGFSSYDMNAKPLSEDQSLSHRTQYQDWERNQSARIGMGMGVGNNADIGMKDDIGLNNDVGLNKGVGMNGTKGMKRNDQEQVIPVVEEKLNISTRPVEKGRVRIYTRVNEQPVEEQVKLRDERVEVERTPADRQVNAADLTAFKEGEIELREMSEEAVVNKEARVVEEVRVRTQAQERTEQVHDTLRKTDVEVERNGERTMDKNMDRTMDRKTDRNIDQDLLNH